MQVAIQIQMEATRALIDAEELFARLENARKTASQISLPPALASTLANASGAAAVLFQNLSTVNAAINLNRNNTTAATQATVAQNIALAANAANAQQAATAQLQLATATTAAAQAGQNAARVNNAANPPGGSGGATSALSFSGLATRALQFAAAYVSVRAAMGIGHEIVDARIELDRLDIGLKSVTSSAEAAANDQMFLLVTTERLGLSLSTTIPEYVKMTAAFTQAGFTGSQSNKVFVDLATATKALGLPTATTNRILYDFQEMASLGTVQMRQLRQVIMQMPGGLEIAARAMGVTNQEFHKLVTTAQLDPTEFITKFAAEAANTFGKTLPEATDNLESHVNRLKNSWTLLLAELGKQPAIKGASDFITNHLNDARTEMELRDAGFDDMDYRQKQAYLADKYPNAKMPAASGSLFSTPSWATIVQNLQKQQTGFNVSQGAYEDAHQMLPPEQQPLNDRQEAALQKLADLREKLNVETLTGLQKEEAQIDLNADKQRQQVEADYAALGKRGDAEQKQRDLESIDAAAQEAKGLAEDKANEKILETKGKIRELDQRINEESLTGLAKQAAAIDANAQRQISEYIKLYTSLKDAPAGEEAGKLVDVQLEASLQKQLLATKEVAKVLDDAALKSLSGRDEELLKANQHYKEQFKTLQDASQYVTVEQSSYQAITKELQNQTDLIDKKYARYYVGEHTLMELEQMRNELEGQMSSIQENDPEGSTAMMEKIRQRDAVTKALQDKLRSGGAGYMDAAGYGFQSTVDQWGNAAQRMATIGKDLADSMSTNITGALVGIVEGTKTAQQAFATMATSIIESLIKVAIEELVVKNIISGISTLGSAASAGSGSVTGDATGASVGSGSVQSGFGGSISSEHAGGLVGQGSRWGFSSSLFRNAPRYHGGGVVGDEVPIVAKRGETVFTPEQMKALGGMMGKGGGGKQATTIINVFDPSMIDQHLAANPGAILNPIGKYKKDVKRVLQ